MGEFLSPGLFRQERKASAGPVANASTSTYATVGWLRKGPENEPQLITSFSRFIDIFGTYWRNSYVPYALAGLFQNEGARAYVTRVCPSDAAKALNASCFDDSATAAEFLGRDLAATVDLSTDSYIAVTIDGGSKHEIDCVGATPAATTPVEIQTAITTAIAAEGTCTVEAGNRIKIVSASTGEASTIVFEEATSNDATAAILGLDVSGSTTYTYSGEAASDWTVTAKWNGAYYNQVRMCLSGNPDYEDGNGGYSRYDVFIDEESAVGEADWETLETFNAVNMDDDTSDYFIEDVVNDKTNLAIIEAGATINAPRALRSTQYLAEWMGEGDAAEVSFSGTLRNLTVHEGSLTVVAAGITATDDGNGNLAGTGITSGTINYTTGAWTLVFAVAPVAGVQILGTYYKDPTSTEVCCQLAGGDDGTGPLTRGDVSDPALEATKVGLYSFNDLDEILNISIPDFAGDVTVSGDLISYAEVSKNRFVILTTPIATEPTDAVKFVRNTAKYNTSYAAIYYPWVKIYDPIANDGRNVTIPPDGHIAGVYARTDINRNVGKAPAGINDGVLLGITGLERVLNKGERDVLYPARINPLVSSPQTGLAVWGARTLSRDAEWLYIQIRRLFMFCEQSIYNASFWIVFENNGPALWQRMKAQGDGFFLGLFRDGYLAGASPDQAFQVVVDSSNNPQEAIDQGIVTADYYIAGNKPAEFVRLRFQQKSQS
jgi:phage tail sheath protein FI